MTKKSKYMMTETKNYDRETTKKTVRSVAGLLGLLSAAASLCCCVSLSHTTHHPPAAGRRPPAHTGVSLIFWVLCVSSSVRSSVVVCGRGTTQQPRATHHTHIYIILDSREAQSITWTVCRGSANFIFYIYW